MNIRLYNARILTMEPGREVFYGEIWVKNDKIAYVAEQKELAEEWDRSQFPRIAWDIELDCKGNLLMPGFKNANSRRRLTRMSYLKSRPSVKISGSGKKVILVPVRLDCAMMDMGSVVLPLAKPM